MSGRRGVKWWPRALASLALIVVGCWPSPGWRYAFSDAFSSIVSPFLEQVTFDDQASVAIAPLPEDRPRIAGEHIVADTALNLRLAKYSGQMQVELSLRRDVWMPLVLFGSLALVAPIPWRRRLATLGAGSALILVTALASILLLLGNIFSGRLPLAPQLSEVYVVSETWGDVLQFLNERWLTPPGNRVIAPLLLAALAWALNVHYWWPEPKPTTHRPVET